MKFSLITASIFLVQSLLINGQALAQKVELSGDPETVEVSPTKHVKHVKEAAPAEEDDAPVKTVHSFDQDDGTTTPTQKPATGKKAAQKYFKKDQDEDDNYAITKDTHYLMLGIGGFVKSTAYKWGDPNKDNPGEFNMDVTYRFGEWVNSMDFLVRIDYQTFDVGDPSRNPKKLSFMPMITFPDAGSKFPLYFGAGGGLGVFFSQIDGRSSLSLDYQLIMGCRFFDIFKNTGFYAETGFKNSLFLFSNGQYNGIFLNVGTVHTF